MLSPGDLLKNRYRIESLLGQGGFGKVYLATDVDMGWKVVVKIPHDFLLTDTGFLRRFEREMKSLLELRHDRIVQILDRGTLEERPFVVLQYLGGQSLKDRVQDRTLSAEEILEWLPDVAKALDFMHKSGFIHRDVKPDNILFNEHNEAFLSDLGITKSLEGTSLTVDGNILGSVKYMAPEALRAGTICYASDQYSLAVVVYLMLSGTTPHTADEPAVLVLTKLSDAPVPLARVAPKEAGPVSDVVMKALAFKPQDRFKSCSDFAEAFQHAVRQGTSPTATLELKRLMPTPTPSPVEFSFHEFPDNKNSLGKWIAAVLFLVGLVGLGAGVLMLPPVVLEIMDQMQQVEDPNAQSAPGTISLTSKPIDAKAVVIDAAGNKQEQKTPFQFQVHPGDSVITLTKPGYREFNRIIAVKPRQTVEVRVELSWRGQENR